MSNPNLTAEEVRRLFNYDPDTGIFTRIEQAGSRKAMSISGSLLPCGYIYLSFNKKNYPAHRIAWLYVYGSLPKKEVDHINGIKTDNRISNLRDVSTSANQQNRKKAQITNLTNKLGVSRFRNKWRARIHIDKKEIHLGVFNDPELAYQAYLKAKRVLHEFGTL